MSSAWNCWHVTIACFYTAIGIAQIAAGVYFLFAVRLIHLSTFLWIGSLDTVIGIGGGIVACLSEISTSRQKVLLFMSVAVLLINTVNTIVSEYYFSINSLYVRNNKLNHLDLPVYKYAKLSGLVLVLVSFIDALLVFVSYSNLKLIKYRRFLTASQADKLSVTNTTATAPATLTPAKQPVQNSASFDPDLAFVIDTPQLKAKRTADVLAHETQTDWVFSTRSVSKQDIGTSTNSPITPHKIIASGVPDAGLETATNDYFLNTLQTFSRSPSPAASMHNLSETESDERRQHTEIIVQPQVPSSTKIHKNNPYSNLMAELEKAFEHKKKTAMVNNRADSVESLDASSVSTSSSSKQLCREVEAVLQSIEHLDSPENEEQPDCDDDDDYQFGSKTSITTSGYSSPTTGQKSVPNLNYSISTNPENNATIISLTTTTPPPPQSSTMKPEEEQSKSFKSVTEITTAAVDAKQANCGRKNRLLSFLGPKDRRPAKKTFLLPELENAILKSESLAFLTRDQLLAKLDQNVALRRKIERKVQQQQQQQQQKQQLGHIVSESHC